MAMLIRLSEYTNIMIPSSLKIHQAASSPSAGSVAAERAHTDFHSFASAPCKRGLLGKTWLWESGCQLAFLLKVKPRRLQPFSFQNEATAAVSTDLVEAEETWRGHLGRAVPGTPRPHGRGDRGGQAAALAHRPALRCSGQSYSTAPTLSSRLCL